jgi:hypothetical protein
MNDAASHPRHTCQCIGLSPTFVRPKGRRFQMEKRGKPAQASSTSRRRALARCTSYRIPFELIATQASFPIRSKLGDPPVKCGEQSGESGARPGMLLDA